MLITALVGNLLGIILLAWQAQVAAAQQQAGLAAARENARLVAEQQRAEVEADNAVDNTAGGGGGGWCWRRCERRGCTVRR